MYVCGVSTTATAAVVVVVVVVVMVVLLGAAGRLLLLAGPEGKSLITQLRCCSVSAQLVHKATADVDSECRQ